MQIGMVIVAAGGAAMTFVVARQVLRDQGWFNAPNFLAACVAGMSFIGLLSAGPPILIGFGALGFACVALPVLRFLINRGCSVHATPLKIPQQVRCFRDFQADPAGLKRRN